MLASPLLTSPLLIASAYEPTAYRLMRPLLIAFREVMKSARPTIKSPPYHLVTMGNDLASSVCLTAPTIRGLTRLRPHTLVA